MHANKLIMEYPFMVGPGKLFVPSLQPVVVLLAMAIISGVWLLMSFSRVTRFGKSRLRTFFTREIPTRWSMDAVSRDGYLLVGRYLHDSRVFLTHAY